MSKKSTIARCAGTAAAVAGTIALVAPGIASAEPTAAVPPQGVGRRGRRRLDMTVTQTSAGQNALCLPIVLNATDALPLAALPTDQWPGFGELVSKVYYIGNPTSDAAPVADSSTALDENDFNPGLLKPITRAPTPSSERASTRMPRMLFCPTATRSSSPGRLRKPGPGAGSRQHHHQHGRRAPSSPICEARRRQQHAVRQPELTRRPAGTHSGGGCSAAPGRSLGGGHLAAGRPGRRAAPTPSPTDRIRRPSAGCRAPRHSANVTALPALPCRRPAARTRAPRPGGRGRPGSW